MKPKYSIPNLASDYLEIDALLKLPVDYYQGPLIKRAILDRIGFIFRFEYLEFLPMYLNLLYRLENGITPNNNSLLTITL